MTNKSGFPIGRDCPQDRIVGMRTESMQEESGRHAVR